MSESRPTRREPASGLMWLALVLCTIGYLLPMPYFELLNNPNENVRVYMTRAIVDFGTFALDPVIAEWGYVNDKATANGLLYSGKAPGTSYLGIPGYWIYSTLCSFLEVPITRLGAVWACRLSGSLLPCIAFIWFFAWHLRGLTRHIPLQLLGICLLAVGSTYYPYAMLFASHSAIAASLFGALIAMEKHDDSPESVTWPFLSGFLLAAAVCMEYPAALGGLLVACWGTLRSRSRLLFVMWNLVGATGPLLALIGYHQLFGGMAETPYGHLENPEFAASHSAGFFGLARIQSVALWGSFFAPSNGLFWFLPWTPLAILALFGGLFDRKLRPFAILTLLVLIAYTIFISMVNNWRGGWTSGPRYIMPVIPFLVSWTVRWLDRAYHAPGAWWWARLATYALAVPAVVACSISAILFPHFPEELSNPIVEIGVWLLDAGYVPATSLSWWGASPTLPALVALTIPALLWLAPHVARSNEDILNRVSGIIAALALGIALMRLGTLPETPDPRQLASSRGFVLNIWPVRQTEMETYLHRGQLPPAVVHSRDPERIWRAAHEAARAGFDQTALDLYIQALSMRDVAHLLPVAGRAAEPGSVASPGHADETSDAGQPVPEGADPDGGRESASGSGEVPPTDGADPVEQRPRPRPSRPDSNSAGGLNGGSGEPVPDEGSGDRAFPR